MSEGRAEGMGGPQAAAAAIPGTGASWLRLGLGRNFQPRPSGRREQAAVAGFLPAVGVCSMSLTESQNSWG